jgi:hypothetical protein
VPWRRGGGLPARGKAGAATRGDEFGEAPEAMFDIDIELRVLRSPLDYEFATHKGRAFLRTTDPIVSATVNNCPASHKRAREEHLRMMNHCRPRIGFHCPADSRVSIRSRRLVMDPRAVATRVVDHGGNEDEDNWCFRRPKPAQITHRHPGPR